MCRLQYFQQDQAARRTHGNVRERKGFTTFQVVCIVYLALLCNSLFRYESMEWETQETATASKSWLARETTNPLSIPKGQARNLPSIRVDEKVTEEERGRRQYGGKGDRKHLGGFTGVDMHGISPAVWKHIVVNWTVQSALDIGCGRGISTSWFYTHGIRVQCVEGSHDAIEQSMLPNKSLIVEHDFSRGPWWPGETFDIAWSVEFLEHVSLQFQYNYLSAMRKAAIVMVTSSRWGGWHHVEVHNDKWWIRKFEAYGFRYSAELTREIRKTAKAELESNTTFPPNGKQLRPQHLYRSMKVFINPAVSALPEHAHLFGEPGCFTGKYRPKHKRGVPMNKSDPKSMRIAQMETPLDPSFLPLQLSDAQDEEWYKIVEANIHPLEPPRSILG